jgi:hypothetical protein
MEQPDLNLDRRNFLKGTGSVLAAISISGTALMHTTEAWGLETKVIKPESMRTLIKIARDIFPHDKLADKFYAIACKAYDTEATKALVETGVAAFDAAAKKAFKKPYIGVGWEAERVSLLKAAPKSPLFVKMRGDLVVSLYNQKELWPIFGYEGESASKGGYISRGFNNITWL